MANTDYIQATIELFGFFLTLIIGMIFQIITVNKRKSEKTLFWLLEVSGFALLVDAGWYIFDGNLSAVAVVINYICNLSIFLLNPSMAFLLGKFLCCLIEEQGERPNRIVVGFIYTLNIASLLVPLSNIAFNWMYCIDAQNIYHRMWGWFVYSGLNSLAIISAAILLFIHRSCISKSRRLAIYFFMMSPFIGIALQSFTIGISFIQLGTAIGSLGILLSYLVDWIHRERKEGNTTEDKKRLWLIECVFGIMILFVSAAIASCIVSVHKISNQTSEQTSLALSFMVSETIEGAVSEPINVSRTMAKSNIIMEALTQENLEGSETEAKMLSFMQKIKDEYGYQMIFVASEKSKAYYTYEGLSRYMDVDSDPNDAWYNEYKARNTRYELNLDEDKDNGMSLVVFVNMEVRDDSGEFVGVCGVGMSISSLLDILSAYEDSYQLNISLTDADGVIQANTDHELIGEKMDSGSFKLLSMGKLDSAGSVAGGEGGIEGGSVVGRGTGSDRDTVTYTKGKTEAVMVKYMDNLDWYLVINDYNPDKIDVYRIIFPSMVIFLLGILLMISFSFGFGIVENNRNRLLRTSRLLSESDRLTGVKNRNAFENFRNSLNLASDTTSPASSVNIIMMDINGLKNVNDSLGHIAGDELIIGATRCIRDAFGLIGEIYRVGGDEFVVISYEESSVVKEKLQLMNALVSDWKGDLVEELAISVGAVYAEENKGYTFEQLLKVADKKMYLNKEEYYLRTGKERRGSK